MVLEILQLEVELLVMVIGHELPDFGFRFRESKFNLLGNITL